MCSHYDNKLYITLKKYIKGCGLLLVLHSCIERCCFNYILCKILIICFLICRNKIKNIEKVKMHCLYIKVCQESHNPQPATSKTQKIRKIKKMRRQLLQKIK